MFSHWILLAILYTHSFFLTLLIVYKKGRHHLSNIPRKKQSIFFTENLKIKLSRGPLI